MIDRLKKFIYGIYHQLVGINDTPQRKALGLGLGVFLGIFPGMGPIAALVGAYIFRVNRAAALIGSVATNTWLSVVTFALAVRIGAGLLRGDSQTIKDAWGNLFKDFHWDKLFEPAILQSVSAILLGFVIISFCLGLIVYLIALVVLTRRDQGLKFIK